MIFLFIYFDIAFQGGPTNMTYYTSPKYYFLGIFDYWINILILNFQDSKNSAILNELALNCHKGV